MSKRDEMRKLREMRMKQLSEADRSTPAEEVAQKAEAATSETPSDKMNPEPDKTTDTLAINTDKNDSKVEKPTINKEERHTASESEPRHDEKRQKISESNLLNDVSSNKLPDKKQVIGNIDSIPRLDFTYRAKDQKCGLTHTTIMLTEECMTILKTRSLQMGMSQQDYFNMLIEEDRTVVDNTVGELTPNELLLGKIDLHGKKSKNITVTIDNYKFMKKAAALRGISQTNYANYIILKEHLREETEGRRPGKYD